MNRNIWKYVERRLEEWGQWLSMSTNAGYCSKSPLVEIIDYGVRTGTNFNILPPYEIDRYNQATHHALLATTNIDHRLIDIAFLENAWQHIEDSATPRGRRALKRNKILSVLGIKNSRYKDLKRKLYESISISLTA